MVSPMEKPIPFSEKSDNIDLFGYHKCTVKLTGLDLSPCAAAKHGHGSKICGFLAKLFAYIVIISMFYRAFTFLGEEGKLLSFNWSEANTYGFMGLHAVVCSICVAGWTCNGRLHKHLKQLSHVKTFRIEPKNEIDEYSGLRKKAFFFSLPWLILMGFTSVFNALHEKILWSGAIVPAYKYSLFPALAFLVWFITSTCLTIYVLVNFSMAREIEYFNEELKKASEEKKLKNHSTIADFSFRQNELIKMVKKSNEFLKSYATVAPLFCFFSIINAIYNLSFIGTVPTAYGIGLVLFLANIIGWTILSFLPPAKVQDQLAATATILMESGEFENAEDPKVYPTYRVMVDRSLSIESRIFVVNAFGINSRNLNVAMFLVPNLGPLLMMLRKLFEYNGYNVSS
uniref:Gustatory receptor n=1 Tax=Caenorhabditis tropicalis TaxID=1561998 RepID=A0A1I7TYV0_9PELO